LRPIVHATLPAANAANMGAGPQFLDRQTAMGRADSQSSITAHCPGASCMTFEGECYMLELFEDRKAAPFRTSEWVGVGYSFGHFGELLQGAFMDVDGSVVRALVTLPYRRAGVVTNVRVSPGSGSIDTPSGKSKTKDVVRAYLEHHGLAGRVNCAVEHSSQLHEGIGMGSSTADLIATVRALDVACGLRTDEVTTAQMLALTEVACDSTMFSGRALLFAQRQGRVLEDFGLPLPPIDCIGFNMCPGETFSTVQTPPAAYSQSEIDCFAHLRTEIRQAIRERDPVRLGAVATTSAEINQRHFPKPNFDLLLRLARRCQALGVSVAHSGTLGALIYCAGKAIDETPLDVVHEELIALNYVPLGRFRA
jgi:uncharacterized protein involved in propanediol utilization